MKKKLLLLASLAICVATIATGTLAYFNAEDKAHNVITSGNVDIELVETTDQLDADGNPIPFENLSGIMPGMEVSKIVQVKNIGEGDAYVRVKVETVINMATGSNAVPDYDQITIDYALGSDAKKWTEKDGYFYYNSPIKPGELTEELFTEVAFDELMGNEYQNCEVIVNVIAHATQVAHNGSSAVDAAGWPEL